MTENTTSTVEEFLKYQKTAASDLRYDLAKHNMLMMHNLTREPKLALDAGCGNGIMSKWLLGMEYHVTSIDSDPAMIDAAGEKLEYWEKLDRCDLHEDNIEDVIGNYTLIICHHVIEYLKYPPRVFEVFRASALPDAELSLITINPASQVIRSIIFNRNPNQALRRLTDLSYDAKWFGKSQMYSPQQIIQWAADYRWQLTGLRGIRCLADYLPMFQSQSITADELLELEKALAPLEPYRSMARYLQFAFKAV